MKIAAICAFPAGLNPGMLYGGILLWLVIGLVTAN